MNITIDSSSVWSKYAVVGETETDKYILFRTDDFSTAIDYIVDLGIRSRGKGLITIGKSQNIFQEWYEDLFKLLKND